MKIGNKFKPNKLFFETYGCIQLENAISKGLDLEVQTMPSKTGKFKYGFYYNGCSYGFDDIHVIPSKPKSLENK